MPSATAFLNRIKSIWASTVWCLKGCNSTEQFYYWIVGGISMQCIYQSKYQADQKCCSEVKFSKTDQNATTATPNRIVQSVQTELSLWHLSRNIFRICLNVNVYSKMEKKNKKWLGFSVSFIYLFTQNSLKDITAFFTASPTHTVYFIWQFLFTVCIHKHIHRSLFITISQVSSC